MPRCRDSVSFNEDRDLDRLSGAADEEVSWRSLAADAVAALAAVAFILVVINAVESVFENEVHYVRSVVTSLRKKLGMRLIRTQPAVGYRL